MTDVALPIETKVREFHGKLWLSLKLIDNGYNIIIGPADQIHNTLDVTKPDVFISKDPGDGNIGYFDRLRDLNISVCGLDPEGGVFNSESDFIQNQENILDHIDAYFAWGTSQGETFQQEYEGNYENLHVTGNPRFDLLQPNYRSFYDELAASHRSKFGKYVLFNGNFSIANPYQNQVISKVEEIYGEIEPERHIYNSRIFNLYLDAIYHIVSETEDVTVIVRPHPSEDNSTYKKEFDRCENVVIEDSGDVRTWIAGAQAVIHHDCTTGIESALMGIPTISYRPIQKEEYESELPISVSKEIQTPKELVDYITESIASDNHYELTDEQINHLKQYFYNVDLLAAENICDVIDDLEVRENKSGDALTPSAYTRLERRIKSSQWESQIISIYDAFRQLIGDSNPRKQRQYREQKFSGLSKDELEETIERLEGFVETDDVIIEEVPLTNDTFYLYEPDSDLTKN